MHLLLIDKPGAERPHLNGRILAAGRRLCAAGAYDLALVDLSRLDRRTVQTLDERHGQRHVPVIALIPRDALGAFPQKDAMPPVAMPRLMAALRALLAAGPAETARSYRAASLSVSPEAGWASFDGRPLTLTRQELDALALLVRSAPHCVPRARLEAAVYGPDRSPTSNAIEAVLSRLRRALRSAGCPARIVAQRGVGWRLATPRNTPHPEGAKRP